MGRHRDKGKRDSCRFANFYLFAKGIFTLNCFFFFFIIMMVSMEVSRELSIITFIFVIDPFLRNVRTLNWTDTESTFSMRINRRGNNWF